MLFRQESDSIGTLDVPAEAYYGVQTLRAKQNFRITGHRMHPSFIMSLAALKKAAAITNKEIGTLDAARADAIITACDEIIGGKLHDEFIVDPIQGGAGTSANMNANEVIANRATELMGGKKGEYIVHPNDHVNMAQSTNDVFPTAGKMTVLELIPGLIAQLNRLVDALLAKGVEFDDVIKMGRTQLQDAVPVRLGQSFNAYAHLMMRDIARIEHAVKELSFINMGGTAIGTAVNANPDYLANIAKNVNQVSGLRIELASDLIDATQNTDAFVTISSALKGCAVDLSKISNDLRLLSSGPRTGVAEINLPAKQNGSSIMPGKVNPVIPEVVSQVAFLVIGNDMTVVMASEAGQLELNAFEPVMFHTIFESITTLTNGISTFVDNCVEGITANREHCAELLENSVGTVTALCPYIGYKQAADLAKESLKKNIPIRRLILDKGIMDEEKLTEILDPMKMTYPTYNNVEFKK
ncbi:MAG: aspartate ammonia-lyase [Ruminococcaceae bacterium]|nr:aspartate ammonia-lyase [Oscillospiraceae bacterium]